MGRKGLLYKLKDGDRREIGRADEVAGLVRKQSGLFAELMAGLWDADRLVRMRAADAAEKASRGNVEILQPFKAELLGLLAEAKEQELRWHLAAMVPRLVLSEAERQLAASSLREYLNDCSSIVKTFAMQGLADLAGGDRALRAGVIEILRKCARTGTPAMKARGRKLLRQLERA